MLILWPQFDVVFAMEEVQVTSYLIQVVEWSPMVQQNLDTVQISSDCCTMQYCLSLLKYRSANWYGSLTTTQCNTAPPIWNNGQQINHSNTKATQRPLLNTPFFFFWLLLSLQSIYWATLFRSEVTKIKSIDTRGTKSILFTQFSCSSWKQQPNRIRRQSDTVDRTKLESAVPQGFVLWAAVFVQKMMMRKSAMVKGHECSIAAEIAPCCSSVACFD